MATTGTFFEVDDSTAALPSYVTGGSVSNPIMAQPLYVVGITVSSPAQGTCSPCNMVIAATLNDTVFAWNTDTSGGVKLLWSRQGAGTNSYGGNALWYDDCGGASGGPVLGNDVLQFEGILSTPVIDTSGATPRMFLTSYCQTGPSGGGQAKWFLHEIDLTTGHDITTANIGHDVRAEGCSACSGFEDSWQLQRPALLLVNNSSNSSNPNLIYILFGAGVPENEASKDYNGWVAAYTWSGSTLSLAFAYSDEPSSCGSLNGNGQCSAGSATPPCDCYAGASAGAPNWGGHGGGCWMSGNGPAATTVGAINSDGAVHTFFGCGNGGFQPFNGATPDSSNNNGG